MSRSPATVPAAAIRRARSVLPSLAAVVAGVGRAAAAAQRRIRPEQMVRKGEGDFVTEVDLRSERKLRRALTRLLPEAGLLGEEYPAVDLERDWLWVLDPIDGTSNFGRGLPQYAVAVALLWQGRPVAAAIFAQPEGSLYTALAQSGARRDGRRIVAADRNLDDASIVGCQWFRGQQDLEFLARLQAKGNRLRCFGSTVTQLLDVACGRLDGNVQEQGRLWDIAAAGLVASEAGCRFTDWQGKELVPFADLRVEHTPSVAAPPRVHRALLRCLAAN